MKKNIADAQVMKGDRPEDDGGVGVECQQLIQAEHFRHLGVEFSKDNQHKYEISSRITKYNNTLCILYQLLGENSIPPIVKMPFMYLYYDVY